MLTPTSSHKPISRERADTQSDDTVDPRWRGLYRAGGAAALVMVALILVQVTVYVVWPPSAFDGPVLPWFELLQDYRLLGLLSLDLLYLIDSALLVVMYLALYVALRKTSESAMLIGTVLGLVGLAAGVLMAVPSSVGTLGTYMALASLLPWIVFSVLVARRLFQLGRSTSKEWVNGN